MITADAKRRGQGAEQPRAAGRHTDLRALAVLRVVEQAQASAEVFDDGLKAEADAEDGDAAGKARAQLLRQLEVRGAARPRRQDDQVGPLKIEDRFAHVI